MTKIEYLNPKINNTEKQEISIQVGLNGFSFAVHDAEHGDCLAFKHYPFKNIILVDELIRETSNIVANETIFNTPFASTRVYYFSQKSTLVPEEFFKPEHLKKYFEFSHSLGELDELHFNYIPSSQAYNVFSVPNYLTSIFHNSQTNPGFYHQATSLITYGIKDLTKKTKALIGINKTFFDIVIFEEGRLVLSNSFQFTNSMDFIYFFLYTCQQLKIDLTKLSVELFGNIYQNEDIIAELSKHIHKPVFGQISLPNLCSNLTPAEALSFYNLFINSTIENN